MTERSRTVTWGDPETMAPLAQSMSGIDILKAMFAGELPAPPIARLIGISMGSVAPGLVTMTLPIGEYLYNPLGCVHGGVAATLLDTVMGCAVHSMLPARRTYTTLEIKVNYIKPITQALGEIIAEGRILQAGRKAAFAEGKIMDINGKVYATGSTTCAVWDL